MNADNIRKAIAVMQRVIDVGGNFVAKHWQCTKDSGFWTPAPITAFAQDEASLHKCGNSACFAGYLSLSSEWRSAMGGFTQARTGTIADWFDVDRKVSAALIYDYTPSTWKNHIVYETPWDSLKPQDVIRVLERMLAEGPDFIIERYNEYHSLP